MYEVLAPRVLEIPTVTANAQSPLSTGIDNAEPKVVSNLDDSNASASADQTEAPEQAGNKNPVSDSPSASDRPASISFEPPPIAASAPGTPAASLSSAYSPHLVKGFVVPGHLV